MGVRVESDGLVTGVKASHVTLPTVHAEVVADDGELLFFGHVINVFEIVITCATNILERGHFVELHLSGFLLSFPELEVVDEFLKSLRVLLRRTLPLPPFFAKVISLRQV